MWICSLTFSRWKNENNFPSGTYSLCNFLMSMALYEKRNKDLALPTCYGTLSPCFQSWILMADCETYLLKIKVF